MHIRFVHDVTCSMYRKLVIIVTVFECEGEQVMTS